MKVFARRLVQMGGERVFLGWWKY